MSIIGNITIFFIILLLLSLLLSLIMLLLLYIYYFNVDLLNAIILGTLRTVHFFSVYLCLLVDPCLPFSLSLFVSLCLITVRSDWQIVRLVKHAYAIFIWLTTHICNFYFVRYRCMQYLFGKVHTCNLRRLTIWVTLHVTCSNFKGNLQQIQHPFWHKVEGKLFPAVLLWYLCRAVRRNISRDHM